MKVLYGDVESVLKINGGLCTPFKFSRGIRQGCSLSGMLYALAIEPMLQQLREHICGLNLPICKSSISLSVYADDVVVLINGQNDVQVLMKVLEDFRVLSSAKVNWNKSEALLIGNWPKGKPSLPDGLTWGTGGFKYLGVYLGDEMSIQKNWEGVVDKVKGRLDKWKWLIPKLSYIGRTLIVNNLVASCLWHRLACLDPPAQILTKIQWMLVDFLGDKLHWVSQSVLYLPKEEGGHGLMHLKSRIAAFHLQFLQRFLYKSSINGWRAVTCAILHRTEGLGLDKSLFLIDPFKVNVNGLLVFYRNLFKVWSLFKSQRNETPLSLYWLLEEPLINGARFDLSNKSCSFHGLNALLQKSQILSQFSNNSYDDFCSTHLNDKGTCSVQSIQTVSVPRILSSKYKFNAGSRTNLIVIKPEKCKINEQNFFLNLGS